MQVGNSNNAHLNEFQSTYEYVPKGEVGSVYFHFIVPSQEGRYSHKFRFYCQRRNEYFGNPISIEYQVTN